ncbi:MAG: hypothetical protein AAF517_17535 [Planctomycetota bacterium]
MFSLPDGAIHSACVLEEPPGTIMACGEDQVVSFYRHPKLVRLNDGIIETSWPHLESGKQASSIVWSQSFPPLALDPKGRRFAVAQGDAIHVVIAE